MTSRVHERSDEDLVLSLKQQPELLNELIRRHWARAVRIARGLTYDSNQAEDAAQNSFLKVFQKSSQFQPGARFHSWFFQILRNSARELVRSEVRRKQREQAQAQKDFLNAESAMDLEEQKQLVREHLAELEEPLSHVLCLRFLEGLSLGAIAHALDLPEGTVSSRIRRGLERLQRSLKPVLALSMSALMALLPSLAEGQVPTPPRAEDLIPAEFSARSGLGAQLSSVLIVAVLLLIAALLGLSQPEVNQEPRNKASQASLGSSTKDQPPVLGREEQRSSSERGPQEEAAVASLALAKSKAKPRGREPRPVFEGRVWLESKPMAGVLVRMRRNGSNMIEPAGDRFECRTDHAGHFGFARLPTDADFWVLEVEQPSFGQRLYFKASESKPWALTERLTAEELKPRELHCVPMRLTGRVRRAQDQEGVDGAKVEIFGQSQVCDHAGYFDMTVARAVQLFFPLLTAEAPGYATAGRAIYLSNDKGVVAPSQHPNIEISLETGKSLSGVVVDESGAAVPGIQLSVQGMLKNQAPKFKGVEISGIGYSWEAESDQSGCFQWSCLPLTGEAEVHVYASDFSFYERYAKPAAIKLDLSRTEPVKLVLKRMRVSWRGRIRDAGGQGIEGAQLVVLDNESQLRERYRTDVESFGLVDFHFGGQGLRRALSDSEGRFVCGQVPVGSCLVFVGAAGYESRVLRLDTRESANLTLSRGQSIQGQVTREDGQAVSRALVEAFPEGTLEGYSKGLSIVSAGQGLKYVPRKAELLLVQNLKLRPVPVAAAMTDNQGRYQIEGLGDGPYDLLVNPIWSFLDKQTHFDVPSFRAVMGSETRDFQLRSLTWTRVQLRAVDAESGRDLEGLRFRVFNPQGDFSHFLDPVAPERGHGLLVPAVEGLRIQIKRPGYQCLEKAIDSQGQSLVELGTLTLENSVGHLRCDLLKAQASKIERVELFIHEIKRKTWHHQSVDWEDLGASIKVPDLTPGWVEVKPFVVQGTWPEQSFETLEPKRLIIEEGGWAKTRLDLRGFGKR